MLLFPFPFCQQHTVWYIPINQLYTKHSLVLYPRGLWCKVFEVFSYCILVFTPSLISAPAWVRLFGKVKKILTVNIIATNTVTVRMWSYVEFCTIFKDILNCEIPALTVEWQCLYGPLLREIVIWIFHIESISTVADWPSVTSQPQKPSHRYVTKTLLFITADCCGWECRMYFIHLSTAGLVYTISVHYT